MYEWVLFIMLSRGPNPGMVPLEYYATKAECIAARKREVDANIKLGLGGGATYVCLPLE